MVTMKRHEFKDGKWTVEEFKGPMEEVLKKVIGELSGKKKEALNKEDNVKVSPENEPKHIKLRKEILTCVNHYCRKHNITREDLAKLKLFCPTVLYNVMKVGAAYRIDDTYSNHILEHKGDFWGIDSVTNSPAKINLTAVALQCKEKNVDFKKIVNITLPLFRSREDAALACDAIDPWHKQLYVRQ